MINLAKEKFLFQSKFYSNWISMD